MEQEDTAKLDLGSLGSLDFTPDWAKKDAGVSVGNVRDRGEGGERGERKPQSDRRQQGGKPAFRRQQGGGDGRFGGGRPPRFQERPQPLAVDVKVLPETRSLGTIMRKLQQDFHAYKLKDLAYFFLDNPQSVLLKITPARGADGRPVSDARAVGFCQCRACGFASTSDEDVVSHILNAHIGDYYDAKEVECEPPKGSFTCVAKCGLSGVLLGPPNIHEFNATVREMIRTRYPNMSEQEYRSRIEMVRDPEAIEEWRKTAVKKTIFVAKGAAEGTGALSREQAEGEFRRTILPSLVDHPKNLMITADVALKSPVRPLQWAVRNALEAERRAPIGMCFALRGAFHNRKMHFFRANDPRGPEFVTGIELKEFDAQHAIPELAKVAAFIAENPCSPKVDIAKDEESAKHLAWLASTGHVVAFTNGVFSAVEKFPKYGPQWQRRHAKKADVKGEPAAPGAAAEPAAAPDAAPDAAAEASAEPA
ncbi:MAG: hypothetical protein IJI73_09040, partial [Kiritimatiellae bacterium]|nr:hypothetical protein [Kiritimatiellia bacterium]